MGNSGLCPSDNLQSLSRGPAPVEPTVNKDAENIRSSSHLLRLWAEVFKAHESDTEWRRISDEVVPVNIMAVPGRFSLLQVEARDNRQPEPVLMATIEQKASLIFKASECFVYWKDNQRNCNFGLNFAAAGDAEKFLECFELPLADPGRRSAVPTDQDRQTLIRTARQPDASSEALRNWPPTLQVQRTLWNGHQNSHQMAECCCPDNGAGLGEQRAALPELRVEMAGWLSVKPWLVSRRNQPDFAKRRRWRPRWAVLRGQLLLLYKRRPVTLPNANGGGGRRRNDSTDSAPHGCLMIDSCIAQAMPEYPRRDFILALSTAHGEAHLLQATSNAEMDSWIAALHAACAIQMVSKQWAVSSGQPRLQDAVRLLQLQIAKLENGRHPVPGSLTDECAEERSVHIYRLRCYLAALLGHEVPSPLTALSAATKASKQALSKFGQLSMTSFHVLVSARSFGRLNCELTAQRDSQKETVELQREQIYRRNQPKPLQHQQPYQRLTHQSHSQQLPELHHELGSSSRVCRLQKRPDCHQFGVTVEAEMMTRHRICQDNQAIDNKEDVGKADIDRSARQLRLVVTGVEPGSVAEEAGLSVGDQVLELDDRRVDGMDLAEVGRLFERSELRVRFTGRSRCRSLAANQQFRRQANSVSVAAAAVASAASSSRSSDSASMRHANSLASWSNRSDSPATAQRSQLSAASLRSALMELLKSEREQAQSLSALHQRLMLMAQQSRQAMPLSSSWELLSRLAAAAGQLAEFHNNFLAPEAIGIGSCNPLAISLIVAAAFQRHEVDLNLYCRLCTCGLRCAKQLCKDRGSNGESWERQLTKPLERIASYQTLLEALLGCVPAGGEEQARLIEALAVIQRLADRVGTLRTLDREFGSRFEQLQAAHSRAHPDEMPVDLSLERLLLYGSVEWLNSDGENSEAVPTEDACTGENSDSGMDRRAGCFVFTSAVALLSRRPAAGVETAALMPTGLVKARPSGRRSSRWLWELADQDGRSVYQLSCGSQQARDDFLQAISDAMAQYGTHTTHSQQYRSQPRPKRSLSQPRS